MFNRPGCALTHTHAAMLKALLFRQVNRDREEARETEEEGGEQTKRPRHAMPTWLRNDFGPCAYRAATCETLINIWRT